MEHSGDPVLTELHRQIEGLKAEIVELTRAIRGEERWREPGIIGQIADLKDKQTQLEKMVDAITARQSRDDAFRKGVIAALSFLGLGNGAILVVLLQRLLGG